MLGLGSQSQSKMMTYAAASAGVAPSVSGQLQPGKVIDGFMDTVFRFDPFSTLKNVAAIFGASAISDVKKAPDGKNFFDYPVTTIDGKSYKNIGELLKGKKATLVVNVASK